MLTLAMQLLLESRGLDTGVKDNNYEHYDSKHEDILNKLLLSFYNGISYVNKDNCNIINTIFKKIIKHKNMGGVKFEISGRLTRRYRADRAVHISRIIGGLNNPDASFKRVSSVILRGYVNANVDFSIYVAKRRIGAFAIKGWISGRAQSTLATPRPPSVENYQLDPRLETGFADGSKTPSLTLSKIYTTRYYSAASKKTLVYISSYLKGDSKLDPNFVTGFADGEGCFTCSITEDQKYKQGWRVKPSFEICLHFKDKPLLE